MNRFRLIAQGVDVSALNTELDANQHLWNVNRDRTDGVASPHRGIRDIWVRWRSPNEPTDDAPHIAIDWPAWAALTSLHPIVRNLSHVVDARVRGGILITETPPGGAVQPHIDEGWHAKFYDTKLYLTLQSDPRCLIHCDGEYQNFREGDVWTYPNNVIHGVENDGIVAHRNIIICFRTF